MESEKQRLAQQVRDLLKFSSELSKGLVFRNGEISQHLEVHFFLGLPDHQTIAALKQKLSVVQSSVESRVTALNAEIVDLNLKLISQTQDLGQIPKTDNKQDSPKKAKDLQDVGL